MPIYLPDLAHCHDFPAVGQALDEPDGLLCMGGDLTVTRLINAYQKGIFPWYNEDEPLLWWSPSQRMVLTPTEIHISRSLIKAIKKNQPQYFINRNFEQVINQCAHITRKQAGRWIHDEMIKAYIDLFKAGHAFSIEVEVNGLLAGGLYGVVTNHIYCGESMFSAQTNGSKYALVGLCAYLESVDISLLDCQLYNPHLSSMGAQLMSRKHFINILKNKK
ncbi:MAG: leucyl/phenylalanyl-tRNA--protein transferase [Proteobacteria bacterium]|nr:leucyl/phenylalanyl-tRNA--protein transferase [Pseudomonadota bacterium]